MAENWVPTRTVALLPGLSEDRRSFLEGMTWLTGFALIIVGVMLLMIDIESLPLAVGLPLATVGNLVLVIVYYGDPWDILPRAEAERAAGYSTDLRSYFSDVDLVDWKTGVVIVAANGKAPWPDELDARLRTARRSGLQPTYLTPREAESLRPRRVSRKWSEMNLRKRSKEAAAALRQGPVPAGASRAVPIPGSPADPASPEAISAKPEPPRRSDSWDIRNAERE